MINKLFVYGTLAPGRPNENILKEIDANGKWVKATVKGRLLEEGWGTKHGYPGMVPDIDGIAIDGLLFISDNLEQNWDKLDEFEGEDYERIIIDAIDNNANIVETYIYKLKEESGEEKVYQSLGGDDGD